MRVRILSFVDSVNFSRYVTCEHIICFVWKLGFSLVDPY
jgi:hypothetical protein